MKFDDETTDVLIGGYLSADAARDDYEAVLASGGYLHGAVVISKDLEGNLSVEQTDHMVREGAAGLGAVGFAVGLFAPPVQGRLSKTANRNRAWHVKATVLQTAPFAVPNGMSASGREAFCSTAQYAELDNLHAARTHGSLAILRADSAIGALPGGGRLGARLPAVTAATAGGGSGGGSLCAPPRTP
jgi:hypothetical protein